MTDRLVHCGDQTTQVVALPTADFLKEVVDFSDEVSMHNEELVASHIATHEVVTSEMAAYRIVEGVQVVPSAFKQLLVVYTLVIKAVVASTHDNILVIYLALLAIKFINMIVEALIQLVACVISVACQIHSLSYC